MFFFSSLIFELQKDKENLKRDIETNKREYEKELKFRDVELEDLRSQSEEWAKSKDSKKRKMTNLNSVKINFIHDYNFNYIIIYYH